MVFSVILRIRSPENARCCVRGSVVLLRSAPRRSTITQDFRIPSNLACGTSCSPTEWKTAAAFSPSPRPFRRFTTSSSKRSGSACTTPSPAHQYVSFFAHLPMAICVCPSIGLLWGAPVALSGSVCLCSGAGGVTGISSSSGLDPFHHRILSTFPPLNPGACAIALHGLRAVTWWISRPIFLAVLSWLPAGGGRWQAVRRLAQGYGRDSFRSCAVAGLHPVLRGRPNFYVRAIPQQCRLPLDNPSQANTAMIPHGFPFPGVS